MKNIIVVVGGAGFIGSNLIKSLLKKSKYKIISLDNYSTGTKLNHISNQRVSYIRSHTKFISSRLHKYRKNIKTLFHFGEFARIFQSFEFLDKCMDSNVNGTFKVFKFCLENKIKLIYSATSASLGNNGNDKNLSPYAFFKSSNLEILENFKKWFNFKFEIIYFYNVYGPNQISRGNMATVIGIFEDAYKNKKPMPVVKPGTQSRRFTHINDTIKVCLEAWRKNNCKHYSIYHKDSFTIFQVAKLFSSKVKYLPARVGERYKSKLTKMNLNNNIIKRSGSASLREYINEFKKKNL